MSRLLVPLVRAPAEGGLEPAPPRLRGRRSGSPRASWRRIARSPLARPALIGFLGTSLSSTAATHPGGFFLNQSEPWLFRVPPFSGGPQDLSLAAFYAGIALLLWAWLAVVRATRAADGPGVGPVLAVMALWAVPLLVGPPLFSGDVYVYAADGQLVSHGLNPYASTPYALGPSPFRVASHGLWLHTVSPYGPLFLRLAGVAAILGAHTVIGTVIALRMFACAGLALCAVSLCAIARRHGQRPAYVLALALLSPLTLLHLVSAGHNDAIMIGLLAAGVALAGSGRPMTGIALCTLAASVKLPAAVAIVFIGWSLLRENQPLRSRLSVLVRGGVASLGTITVVSVASGLGWGWLGALGVPGVAAPRLAIVNDLAFGFDKPIGVSFLFLLHAMRDIGMVLAVVIVAYLALRSRRSGDVLTLGAALMVVAVLGPSFYPWYLTWGLIFVAAAAADRWERAIIWPNVVMTVAVAPGGAGWLDQLSKPLGTWVARSVVGAAVAAIVVTVLRPWWVVDLFRTPRVEPALAGGPTSLRAGPHPDASPDAPVPLAPARLAATTNGSGEQEPAAAGVAPSAVDGSEGVVS